MGPNEVIFLVLPSDKLSHTLTSFLKWPFRCLDWWQREGNGMTKKNKNQPQKSKFWNFFPIDNCLNILTILHWLQGSCWCEPCYHQYNGELVSEEYFELISEKYFKQFVLSIFCFSETGNSPFKCVCLCPDFHRTFRQYIHSFRCRFIQLRFPQRTWGVHSGIGN